MPLILKTPQAQSDLLEIWNYIAQDSPTNADNFLDTLQDKCASLARSPEIGRRRDELLPNVRSFPVGNYVIFYQPMERGINIIRVLHGARDIPKLFS